MNKIFCLLALCFSTVVTGLEVVQRPEMVVVGIECKTSNTAETGLIDIPNLWARFFKEGVYDQIPNKASCEVISLYTDYESDFTGSYTTLIGCQVEKIDQLPHGLSFRVVPASSYAVFPAVGDQPKSVIETWKAIWKLDLDRTYTGDFEVYGDKFYQDPKQVDIFIAID